MTEAQQDAAIAAAQTKANDAFSRTVSLGTQLTDVARENRERWNKLNVQMKQSFPNWVDV